MKLRQSPLQHLQNMSHPRLPDTLDSPPPLAARPSAHRPPLRRLRVMRETIPRRRNKRGLARLPVPLRRRTHSIHPLRLAFYTVSHRLRPLPCKFMFSTRADYLPSVIPISPTAIPASRRHSHVSHCHSRVSRRHSRVPHRHSHHSRVPHRHSHVSRRPSRIPPSFPCLPRPSLPLPRLPPPFPRPPPSFPRKRESTPLADIASLYYEYPQIHCCELLFALL